MKREEKLNDYEGFVEKFKPKKTTDDCYTPPCIYEAVLSWVKSNADIAGREIVHPFYPGGDYEHYNYPAGCVVVDNPPFSIFSQILRFYQSKGIAFFLFGPHLTLFKPIDGLSYIITDTSVRYENGAIVNTSFVTNLPSFAAYGVIGSPELKERIEEAQKKSKGKEKKKLPVYSYPFHLVTTSSVAALVGAGLEVRIPSNEMTFIRTLDAQRALKKSTFGHGLLVSDRVAEKLKEEKLKADKLKETYRFELSDRERSIIEQLNSNTHP